MTDSTELSQDSTIDPSQNAVGTGYRSNRLALWATFVLVVLPTTLMSLVGTVLGLGMGKFWPVLALSSAGWFGVVTLWRLFIGLWRQRPPRSTRVIWAGLTAGCAVSLLLAVSVHDIWSAVFFGWPLLAALYFGNEFSRTYPLVNQRSGSAPTR